MNTSPCISLLSYYRQLFTLPNTFAAVLNTLYRHAIETRNPLTHDRVCTQLFRRRRHEIWQFFHKHASDKSSQTRKTLRYQKIAIWNCQRTRRRLQHCSNNNSLTRKVRGGRNDDDDDDIVDVEADKTSIPMLKNLVKRYEHVPPPRRPVFLFHVSLNEKTKNYKKNK